jgi:RimJ/RimL family protein N-acetyltransferase
MDLQIVPVAFEEIEVAAKEHLAGLPSAIDSFLEDHILASRHYRLDIDDEPAGFASIHNESLITQFALTEQYRRHGQQAFNQVRRMEQVQSAFVPTCDEFYLANAIDDYRQLEKQAYFFAALQNPVTPGQCSLRAAEPADAGLVRQESGDFFAAIERHIESGELFVTMRMGEPVGFGIMERSKLYSDVASIGMFTIERFRREGIGTATISLLIEACRNRGLRPIAGCWYYNHRSKRTLERAGMYAASRLLKISY